MGRAAKTGTAHDLVMRTRRDTVSHHSGSVISPEGSHQWETSPAGNMTNRPPDFNRRSAYLD